jgi:hypothetical protein
MAGSASDVAGQHRGGRKPRSVVASRLTKGVHDEKLNVFNLL